jgi:hypothetical protein
MSGFRDDAERGEQRLDRMLTQSFRDDAMLSARTMLTSSRNGAVLLAGATAQLAISFLQRPSS